MITASHELVITVDQEHDLSMLLSYLPGEVLEQALRHST